MDNNYLLLIVSLTIAWLCVLTAFLAGHMRQVTYQLRQLNVQQNRLSRDLGQHRYALAILRRAHHALVPDEEDLDGDDTERKLTADIVADLDLNQDILGEVPQGLIKDLSDKEVLVLLKQAIQKNHIDMLVQPIVALPERDVKFFEVFSRLTTSDGQFIPASRFVQVARDNNLLGVIDNLLLLRCLQLIKKNASALGYYYFCNISAQTLNSKQFMADLVEFLEAHPKLATHLVFEMTQIETLHLSPTAKQIMEGLSLLGCQFAMDQVTILGMDIDRLHDCNIAFVKFDANHLIKEMSDITSRKRLKKIKDTLEQSGVAVIAEKVEHEQQLVELIDLYLDYGQGYLFGVPKKQ